MMDLTKIATMAAAMGMLTPPAAALLPSASHRHTASNTSRNCAPEASVSGVSARE